MNLFPTKQSTILQFKLEDNYHMFHPLFLVSGNFLIADFSALEWLVFWIIWLFLFYKLSFYSYLVGFPLPSFLEKHIEEVFTEVELYKADAVVLRELCSEILTTGVVDLPLKPKQLSNLNNRFTFMFLFLDKQDLKVNKTFKIFLEELEQQGYSEIEQKNLKHSLLILFSFIKLTLVKADGYFVDYNNSKINCLILNIRACILWTLILMLYCIWWFLNLIVIFGVGFFYGITIFGWLLKYGPDFYIDILKSHQKQDSTNNNYSEKYALDPEDLKHLKSDFDYLSSPIRKLINSQCITSILNYFNNSAKYHLFKNTIIRWYLRVSTNLSYGVLENYITEKFKTMVTKANDPSTKDSTR